MLSYKVFSSVYMYVITFPKSFSFLSFQSEKWWKSFGKYFISFLFLLLHRYSDAQGLSSLNNCSLHIANLGKD